MSAARPASFRPHNAGEIVWQDVCDLLRHPAQIEEALRRARGGAWLPQELHARHATLQKAARSLAQQRERLTEAYLAGVLELDEYRRRKADLTQRAEALQSQERQLEAGEQRQEELTRMVESIQDFCQRVREGLESASFEQKRQLVELLLDGVVVTNGEVEIRYVIPTSPKGEQVRFSNLRTDYFHPGSQAEGIADRACDLARQVGDEIPGGFRRQRLGIGGDLEEAHRPAGAEDRLAQEAQLGAPVGEVALERASAGLADTLARQEPDAIIGADGDHILQLEAMQRTDERPAVPVEAVGQHHAEAEPQGQQRLDHRDRQLGLGLVRVAGFEARLRFEDAAEQREGGGAQHPVGVDRDDAIGQRVQVADVLGGHVDGGVAFLAVAGLVDTQDEGG